LTIVKHLSPIALRVAYLSSRALSILKYMASPLWCRVAGETHAWTLMWLSVAFC
jgi:hypothetical protein